MLHLELSEAEWDLMLQLLEAERRELPTEIRHTGRTEVHDQLKQRQETVDHIIERMREQMLS